MIQRLVIAAALVAFAYYVGVQVGRGEEVQRQLNKKRKQKPQNASQQTLIEKKS